MFSLPSLDLQRRLISFVLTRSLGHYLELGSLPDFKDGSVVLSNLRLNVAAVQQACTGLPIVILQGHMASLSLSLSTPVSWSSTLHIAISGLSLDVQLEPHADVIPEDIDLAASMAASIIQDDDRLPGDFNSSPTRKEEHDPTLIASLIERLAARLSLQIQSADITLHAGLTSSRASVASFSLTSEDLSRGRSIELKDLVVALQAHPAPCSPSTASSDDSFSSAHEMAMSMAIADLRHSVTVESPLGPACEWQPLLRADDLQLAVKFASKGWKLEHVHVRLERLDVVLWPEHLAQLKDLSEAIPRSNASDRSKSPPPTPQIALDLRSATVSLVYDTVASPRDWKQGDPAPASSLGLSLSLLYLEYQKTAPIQVQSVQLAEVSPTGDATPLVCLRESPDQATNLPSDGFNVALQDQKATIKLPPLHVYLHLGLLQRIQPWVDYLNGLPPSRSQERSPPARAPAPFEVDLACPGLDIRVQCPSEKRAEGALEVDVGRLHVRKTGSSVRIGIGSVGMAHQQPGKPASPFLSCASITFKSTLHLEPDLQQPIPRCTLFIQTASADLHKTTLDGLQFFADDLGNLFAAAPSPASSPRLAKSFREASEGSVSRTSSGFDLDGKSQVKGKTFDLAVKVPKVTCALHTLHDLFEASFDGLAVQVAARSSVNKNEVCATLTLATLGLTNSATSTALIKKMGPADAVGLSVRFISAESASATKTSKISIRLDGFVFVLPTSIEPLQDLSDLFKPPAGVFENTVPADQTLLVVQVSGLGIEPLSTRLMIELSGIQAEVKLNAKRCQISATLGALSIWQTQAGHSPTTTWLDDTYVRLVHVSGPSMQVVIPSAKDRGLVALIEKPNVVLELCQDSLKTLTEDLQRLATLSKADREGQTSRSAPTTPGPGVVTSLDASVNVLDSISASAFNISRLAPPTRISGADLLPDDVPRNSTFLDSKSKGKAPAAHDGDVTMLSPHGLQVRDSYLQPATYEHRHPQFSKRHKHDQFNLELRHAKISVRLFGGFDWPETRAQILEDLRARQRHLKKLKSMLDEQQNAAEQARLAKEDSALQQLISQLEEGLRHENLKPSPPFSSTDDQGTNDDELQTDFYDWETLPSLSRTQSNTSSASTQTAPPPSKTKTLNRSSHEMMEFLLEDVNAVFRVQGPASDPTTSVDLRAFSFQILDHIPTSTWRKFLTEMRVHEGGNSRAKDVPMVRAEVIHTVDGLSIKVKLFPIRLYVDQDAVDFLKRFFASEGKPAKQEGAAPEAFISRLEILPIKIRLDYKPKHVNYALLPSSSLELMNFFHFASSDLTLRHITLQGITASAVNDALQDIWTPDVKANQLADVVAGINPLRSVVQVGGGLADLVLLPIEQFKKDGRVIRGLRKGADSFSKKTALESLKLGAKLAGGTQVVLEKAEKVLGASLTNNLVVTVQDDEPEEARSKRAVQPRNAKEGLKEAYDAFSGSLRNTAQTILAVPMEVYETNSQGSVKKVLRAIPVAVLHPAIGATEAVQKTLLGVANTIDRQGALRRTDKYKPLN